MGRNKMGEQSRIGGGTSTYEAMLERKRAALRRALKTEYINKSYNPKNYTAEGYIGMHDASLMRYHAMHKTSSEFWYPNIRSFFMFLGITILPIATHYYLSS